MQCMWFAVLLAILVSSADAQRKIVIPPDMASKGTSAGLPIFLDFTKPSASRGLQAAFRAGPKDGGKITAMSFRPISNTASGAPKFTVAMELGFSSFKKNLVDLGPWFLKNRGKDFTYVFKGSVAFPAVPAKLRKVSAFLFRIPFQKSFVMKANSNVLWDLHVKSSSEYSSRNNEGAYIEHSHDWPYQDPRYRVTYSGSSCPRAGIDNMIAATNMAVGHRFWMTKGPVSTWKPNPLGVLILSGSTTKWGPVKLPFSLGSFGAPGCSIYVSLDAVIPAFHRSGSWLFGGAVLPRQQSLVGQSVYGQGFLWNADNRLRIQSSNMVEWKIGPWFPIRFAYVNSDVNMYPSKTGAPHDSNIPIFQLEIQ